ncbi:hypothetical protein F0358_10240 [Empedobacter brevis]|uniref:hypothetical protein n=1 Tax=Empedobacter brevis TaxID=247 RepID=UPI00123E2311|nr:hypothetical protein [Empedobacter brevis]QES93061.1 hypothetical protein F0358_10240 [Empedobacter brevis]
MKIIFSLFFILTFFNALAQKFELKDSILLENKMTKTIDTDLNNSIYLISDTKVEKRFQTKKNKIVDLKNVITSVDTTNPLRSYVYSNFNQLTILDEDLNPIQDIIQLKSTDFMPVALKVVDNQFCWFYDIIGNKLMYFNYQLQKPILSSKQIYLKNNDQSIDKIHVYKNSVYLKAQKTIYIYDDYGNFKSNFELDTENQPFYFYKDVIFYVKNNELISINMNSKVSTIFIELKKVKSMAFNETNFYTLDGDKVNVYAIIK